MNNAAGAVIAVAIVALLIVRQLRTRPVREAAPMVMPAVLGALGIAALVFGVRSVTDRHPMSATTVVLVVATLLLAAPFGWIRARSITVWRDGTGRAMRRGSVPTAALWLASIATHLTLGVWTDHTAGGGLLGTSTVYLYLALTLGIQNAALRRRAAAIG